MGNMEKVGYPEPVHLIKEVLIYYTGGALPLQTTLAGD